MTDLGLGALSPQPAPPNVPEANAGAPFAYISAVNAMQWLQTRWSLIPPVTPGEGVMLAASMALDEEGPFYGVKADPEQEREWPRSFKFGWPNITMTPDAMLLTETQPGAFYLNYEGVVPDQVVDWVCLEAYRMSSHPLDKEIGSESVTGASVKYIQWTGKLGDAPAQLDRIQAALLSPFLVRQLRTAPWAYYASG